MSSARSRETSLQLARETRERFVTSTLALIAPTAVAIRERLAAAANLVATAREMQEHRDDFLAFRAQEINWVNRSQAAWRKAVADGGAGASTLNSLLGLELIGDDVVETNILASRLGLLIQDKVSFELNDLRLRIQELDGRGELASRDVLKPESLARLLVEQWLAAGLTRALWTKVQDTVRHQLMDGLLNAYQEANHFLIDKGVMREIDLKRFVRRTGAQPSGASPLGQGGGGYGGGMMSHPVPIAPASGMGVGMGGGGYAAAQGGFQPGAFAPAGIGADIAAQGYPRLFGAGEGMAASEPAPGGAMGMGGGTGMGVPAAGGGSPLFVARQRAQGVLLNLKRFVTARLGGDMVDIGLPADGGAAGSGLAGSHAGAGGEGPRGGGSQVFMAAIADAAAAYSHQVIREGENEGAAGVQQSAAELRRRTNELKRKAPTTADKATVEIVALMFQAILAEERIPFSARVWFARLQMPVLRVAIAEPEFFGTLQHPARMLIDRMGSCVMGFEAAAITGSALEGEIRRVVQVIEQYPETGQRVFKLVYEEFVSFLSKYLTQSDTTQRVMSVAQQVEQKETMAIQYTIELRKMLNDMPVREEIREFLFKVWAEVLAIAALRYGGQDEQTVTLKRAASELVWAASAKPNRTDRTRVIQDLPQLLQRLRQGMTLLGVVGDPLEAHIKTIGDTLADAFMSKTEAIAPAKIEAMAQRLAHIEDFVSDEGAGDLPFDAASIELLLGVDAASIEVVPNTGTKVAEDMLEWVRELQVGTWFMLDHNGRVTQVQFVWRSERQQLHLFASGDGRSFLIQAGRLASYLQAGLLVPAEEETLTVRATREALAKLDANPERLLN
ncbi:MAG: DUF1631 family protein [Comamonadaceae bacterium]|nr:MAG: DUF1631 family protein [Comamonadaceae bacterium]